MAAPVTLELFFGGLAIMVISAQERPCGCCGEPRRVFINRDGQTRCWQCDAKARAQAAQGKDTVRA